MPSWPAWSRSWPPVLRSTRTPRSTAVSPDWPSSSARGFCRSPATTEPASPILKRERTTRAVRRSRRRPARAGWSWLATPQSTARQCVPPMGLLRPDRLCRRAELLPRAPSPRQDPSSSASCRCQPARWDPSRLLGSPSDLPRRHRLAGVAHGCRLTFTTVGYLALQADDRRDLNRYPERELACPERLAGVAPTLAKDFKDQVAGAVEDLRLLLETRRRADEAAELDELLDLVERSGVLADERHDVQRADLRRPAGVLQTDIAAHHPAELDLAVPAGDDARGIEELADLLDRHVGGERLGGIRELETERPQGRLSGIHAQDPSRPCGEQPRSPSSARLGRTVGKRLAWPAAHHHPEPVKGWLTCPTWL